MSSAVEGAWPACGGSKADAQIPASVVCFKGYINHEPQPEKTEPLGQACTCPRGCLGNRCGKNDWVAEGLQFNLT